MRVSTNAVTDSGSTRSPALVSNSGASIVLNTEAIEVLVEAVVEVAPVEVVSGLLDVHPRPAQPEAQ